ncbi:helix-turn-helix transcriptional regulator [Sporosarcina sp. NPDC096371]|uniref:helix-turn-helix transcriptional regulator n=1 Tax=Sporosarcina sp. NPDC096371 TaxID=3364530 RepID=UPI0037F45796
MTTYLTNYAHFTNKHDMDEAVNRHLTANWNDLNKTDRAVLDMIRRYSVKYGAAHLKHDTIATTVDKSNVTVRRAIRKLEKLGIIERIHYIRPVMNGLGANIYAILPFHDQSKMTTPEEAEKPCNSKLQEDKPKTEPLFSKSITTKDLKRTSPAEQSPTTLFGKMKALLSTTIGEDSLARRLFGVYRAQSLRLLKFSIYEDQTELFEDLAIQALHISVQATKRKNIQNIPGYFDGVLRELIDKALFGEIFKEYNTPIEGVFCR